MLAGAVASVGALGIPAWWLSESPRGLAIVAGLAGLAWALWLAWRELARPVVTIVLQPSGSVAVDGMQVDGFDVSWRSVLVGVQWCSSERTVRRLAFPDAIDAAGRRELRLWALQRREDAPPAAVAP